ncbi:MAG: hypothetical protein NVSMB9_01870 [Isosphaeraceae bacterium]
MRTVHRFLQLSLALAALLVYARDASAQDVEPEIERPAPPALDDFETDRNEDGVPDGWYNLRDARIMTEGGVVGPKYLKFSCIRPGRPARLSRAFGVDGRVHEAIIIGLWVRLDQVQSGERLGEEPGLLIDFLGDKLRQETRGALGPWTVRSLGAGSTWKHVVRRIPVPVGALDAIMTVGLLGATGVLDVDGLTMELVPIGGTETTNLAKNGDFELGDPDPSGWIVEGGARRSFPGHRSTSALELTRAGARCLQGLALSVESFPYLDLSVQVRGRSLRVSGGAAIAHLFFLKDDGRVLPEVSTGVPAFRWEGSFDWREDRVRVPVPKEAVRAVIQFEKSDALGSVLIDDLAVTAGPDPLAGAWTPYHIGDKTEHWLPVTPSQRVDPDSALDFSFLLDSPAGKKGTVAVKEGRLNFARGGRARFLGVQLLPPAAFLDGKRADLLADRLARSGVNLVRLGDLDTPLGPDRSLFDDTRDDTTVFDEVALAKLDHLIFALKARGIYVALELQSARQFRSEDGVAMPGALPPGGGPAAIFNPVITKKTDAAARALLAHKNPETGLALKDDPALAWVTLAGEVSMFNLIDDPTILPGDYAKEYRDLAARSSTGLGRKFWQALESTRWKTLADELRKGGLKAPIAGVSHWRREAEFVEAQTVSGLDLIDDRVYWTAPPWIAPDWKSMLWSKDHGIQIDVAKKRRQDRPYVIGQWCDFTRGVWALPFEAAEQLLVARMAVSEDWDGLVRRGIFLFPEPWGLSPPGTAGGEDIFQIPEVANAAPQVFALWPHQASIFLRGTGNLPRKIKTSAKGRGKTKTNRGPLNRTIGTPVEGWEPERGRLLIDSPYTQGFAGWPGGESVSCPDLTVDLENPYGVVVASSVGPEPIALTKRLLVTAIGRITPTGFRWVDEWRREMADPGRPPLLQEPLKATITWKREGTVQAYALDNNGTRIGPAKMKRTEEGTTLVLDGTLPSLHFELVVETSNPADSRDSSEKSEQSKAVR